MFVPNVQYSCITSSETAAAAVRLAAAAVKRLRTPHQQDLDFNLATSNLILTAQIVECFVAYICPSSCIFTTLARLAWENLLNAVEQQI